MIKVITYGTYDLLHNGHINLLKHAKELGNYLIVGVTTDNYDRERGKLNVQNDLVKRIEDVKKTGLADRIIVEEYFGQKIDDIQKYRVDIFAIGSDWKGQFDYLNEFCKVVYLERTKGVSSTQLRNEQNKIINLGVISSRDKAAGFLEESKYVSGIEADNILYPEDISSYRDIESFAENIDAVFIGSQTPSLAESIRIMLERKKHVLFQESMGVSPQVLNGLYDLARGNSLVLLEAIGTAFCPAFNHLNRVIKSKKIGAVKDIAVSYPELSSCAILPIVKLLGGQYDNLQLYLASNDRSEQSIRGAMQYSDACATFQVGKGAKSSGSLIISGTDGYAYVPPPWWKTEAFEIQLDENQTEKYYYKMAGNGLRYVVQEFIKMIQFHSPYANQLLPNESTAICSVIDTLRREKGLEDGQS